MAADLKELLRCQKELEGIRLQREPEWQLIADYFLPTKDFMVDRMKGASIPRRVMTSVPQKALARFAAMLIGFLVDPTRPFIKPNVAQGLINAGRNTPLDAEANDYLDNLSWSIFDRMMSSRSGFMSALARMALELAAFGTAIIWTGQERGFGPIYMSRPLRACWIDVDDADIVNRVHYRFELSVADIFGRWPEAANRNADLVRLKAETGGENKRLKVLHCVYPRQGGEKGGFANLKPYAEVTFIPDFSGVALEEGGYDEFPYAVPRVRVSEGNPYGQGFAWQALPDAITLNRLQDMVEFGVGQSVAPPFFMPVRMMGGKKINRSLGAINYYDPKMAGFLSLKEAMQAMPMGGDIGIGVEYMNLLAKNINDVFMTDWLTLPEHSGMTATEINDRRQLRAVGLTGLLPAVERELMGVLGDRTLAVMIREDMIADAPDSLADINVEWDYAGPLAIAQQQNQVDAVQRLMTLAQQAESVKPGAADVVVFDEGLRLAAEALGLPPGMTVSRADIAALRAQQAQQAQAQTEAQTAATSGQALRDGAQGLQSLQMAQAA